MSLNIRITDTVIANAGAQLLGNNIEAYENTIPDMLSNRLRNPKFAGPENPQTGIAPEWEPIMNNMQGFSCRLIPGQYLSGREAQSIHNFSERFQGGILQAGITVREGEVFEFETWGRAMDRPVRIQLELRLPGQEPPADAKAALPVELAHWHRCACRIASPGNGKATLFLRIGGDSRLVLDQVHLRPVGESHVSQAVKDAFERVPCPVLRFPGGCASCTYHWEHGVGPVHRRPVCDDPVFKFKMQYDFGTDEYLDLCMARNIRPFITLNTTTATPEDAAAWAAYIRNRYVERGRPVPAAYFMFGNENYGTWEIGHMTGEMYVAQLRAFIPPVRAAYPEARMAVLGEFQSEGLRDAYKTPWRQTVLENAGDLFDMLAVTRYAWTNDSMSLAESIRTVAQRVAEKSADLDMQARDIRETGTKATIGIVEWNYWTRASHNDHAGFYEPNDIRHCLYAAGLINVFCRHGDLLETANYYSLFNVMGMMHTHDGRVQDSDVVKVFNLYADALPGDALALEFESLPMLTDTLPMVDANVIRRDGGMRGYLVNYSTEESVEVRFQGDAQIRAARGIRAEAILAPVACFTPAFEGDSVTLPPMSLVRVDLGG